MSLKGELQAFLRSGRDELATFNALALRLFAYQYTHNIPYRRLCDARGATPRTVTDWNDLPTVPASAFKRFVLSCAPEADCARVFHSSGTTTSETSRHFLDADALELYTTSLTEGFARFIPDESLGIVALMPSPDHAPHSSLSYMLGALGATFFAPPNDRWVAQVSTLLRERCTPRCYFGTAFAWIHFFDATHNERFVLPEGSVVIETGGFKGRSREVSREELYGLFADRLGAAPNRCFSEYGMSELASQFYSVGVSGPKLAPPWLKTRIVDPVTGLRCASGEPGLLAHVDLANYNSVLAIQTEDLGVAHPDGGFTLLGRAPGAVLRGCSLTAEDW